MYHQNAKNPLPTAQGGMAEIAGPCVTSVGNGFFIFISIFPVKVSPVPWLSSQDHPDKIRLSYWVVKLQTKNGGA